MFNLIKGMIGNSFDKKGIFETVWLCINHWNKVSLSQLRHFLKMNDGGAGLDDSLEGLSESEKQMRHNIKMQLNAQKSGSFKNSRNDQETTTQGRLAFGSADIGRKSTRFDSEQEMNLLVGDQETQQRNKITKYTTRGKEGFNINLTSSGLSKQLQEQQQ